MSVAFMPTAISYSVMVFSHLTNLEVGLVGRSALGVTAGVGVDISGPSSLLGAFMQRQEPVSCLNHVCLHD